MGVAGGRLVGTGLGRSRQPSVLQWLDQAASGFLALMTTWALLPDPLCAPGWGLQYSWTSGATHCPVSFQSRGCAPFRGLCMQRFPLLCKLASTMAPLGSQLKEFQPIKRKYYVF